MITELAARLLLLVYNLWVLLVRFLQPQAHVEAGRGRRWLLLIAARLVQRGRQKDLQLAVSGGWLEKLKDGYLRLHEWVHSTAPQLKTAPATTVKSAEPLRKLLKTTEHLEIDDYVLSMVKPHWNKLAAYKGHLISDNLLLCRYEESTTTRRNSSGISLPTSTLPWQPTCWIRWPRDMTCAPRLRTRPITSAKGHRVTTG